jgi:tripartite-type tricarboxylate transporter receptor subunit TctC
MKNPMKCFAGAMLLAGACCAAGALAQSFPEKPVRVLVPFAPGGSVDAVMRFLGPSFQETTGQQLLVENRPGGGSFIGMGACAKAPPDGYTMCATTADSLTFSRFLYSNIPFDVENDFTGVTNMVTTSGLLFTSAQSPLTSFKEVIAQEKAKPGSLNIATWGPGTAPDLYARFINRELGLKLVQIPYKGAGPALTAALGGEVQISYFGIGAVLPQIRAGKLRALVATSQQRSKFLPDVPSLAEFGIDPGFTSYFGLYAPAKTPAALIERLNAVIVRALRTPAAEKFFAAQTLEIVGNSAAEFTRFMQTDREAAGRLIRSLGIKPTDAPS